MKKYLIPFLFVFFPFLTFANLPQNQGYVTDLSDIFSDNEKQQLISQIQKIEKDTTAEIAVITVQTTNGEDIAQFATDVGQTWGIGKKDKDNGLVIAIATEDKKWFIASGYGLEGTIPDAIAKRIGEKYFPTNFRAGKYFNGVSQTLLDIEKLLQNDPTIKSEYVSSDIPVTLSSDQFLRAIAFGFLEFWILIPTIVLGKKWVMKKKEKHIKRSFMASLIHFLCMVFLGFLITSSLFLALVFSFIPALFSLIIFSSKGNIKFISGNGFWGRGGGGGFGGGSSGGGFGGGGFGGGGGGGSW